MTALGLAVAIPAVLAYNIFNRADRVRHRAENRCPLNRSGILRHVHP
ncbi:hypothetical protein [Thermithiobacillus plumbiphilus]|uniref:MotA/TolQ/ExbB proton channel domain-containing protein n=1 Tax=Thermithiobacillus plumbiphilus TaxID=1729899 RepID=A0ABU9D4V6_9PROT